MCNEKSNETGVRIGDWSVLSFGSKVYVSGEHGGWRPRLVISVSPHGDEPTARVVFQGGDQCTVIALDAIRLKVGLPHSPPNVKVKGGTMPRPIRDPWSDLRAEIRKTGAKLDQLEEMAERWMPPATTELVTANATQTFGRLVVLAGLAFGAGLAMGAFLTWWAGSL